ncbi:MAG: hypothetical protein U5N58_08760 [Actinomycetota bacterium]|nr:hypothetical protein [Actinomycetota bacterium]
MIKLLNMFYGNDVVNSIFIEGDNSLVIVDTGVIERKQQLLDEYPSTSIPNCLSLSAMPMPIISAIVLP